MNSQAIYSKSVKVVSLLLLLFSMAACKTPSMPSSGVLLEPGDSAAVKAGVQPPSDFAEFWAWPASRQLEVVTASMKNPNMAEDVIRFYRHSLANNTLDALTRNNMAQALLNQRRQDTELWRLFAALFDDSAQEKTWRIYCLQHMTSSAAFASEADRRAIHDKLVRETKGKDRESSARAMIMLDEFERSGYGSSDDSAAAINSALENSNAGASARISALALIGSRKDASHLPEVRDLARRNCPEQRAAVATLGLIGDKSDIALLESLHPEAESMLDLALKPALKRLRERTASNP